MSNQRNIVRHPNGNGSVMTLDVNGKIVELFVADAKYRAAAIFSRYLVDLRLNYFDQDKIYINPKNAADYSNEPLAYEMTDTELQARFSNFKSDCFAESNCATIFVDGKLRKKDAVRLCRINQMKSLENKRYNVLDLKRWNLPNISELIAIYLESDRLDALDPTVNENPDFALGCRNPNGRFALGGTKFAWSCTVESIERARAVFSDGNVGSYFKTYEGGVIPVVELSIKNRFEELTVESFLRKYDAGEEFSEQQLIAFHDMVADLAAEFSGYGLRKVVSDVSPKSMSITCLMTLEGRNFILRWTENLSGKKECSFQSQPIEVDIMTTQAYVTQVLTQTICFSKKSKEYVDTLTKVDLVKN